MFGFAILVACLKAGEWLQHAFGLILPGNILGLFLLLALLGTGIVPPRWVESSARLLLWLLPFLFMPIFILAMSNRTFWAVQGRALAGSGRPRDNPAVGLHRALVAVAVEKGGWRQDGGNGHTCP